MAVREEIRFLMPIKAHREVACGLLGRILVTFDASRAERTKLGIQEKESMTYVQETRRTQHGS